MKDETRTWLSYADENLNIAVLARECLSDAIRIFEENGAEIYLKQAKDRYYSTRIER